MDVFGDVCKSVGKNSETTGVDLVFQPRSHFVDLAWQTERGKFSLPFDNGRKNGFDFETALILDCRYLRDAFAAIKAMEKSELELDDEDGDPVEGNWDRVFKRTDDQLSLLLLPNGKFRNADSIVLLIYGYQKLYGQNGVPVTSLMEAAKQSGLRIDRVNRNLPKSHQQFLITGGTGKGARYSLNNRGMAYAQELLEGMFE